MKRIEDAVPVDAVAGTRYPEAGMRAIAGETRAQ
ncbi:hypothetical protein JOD54_000330 [Actinokineospora baliensis]|nr:hypothetical protein [Actinokineospora baliensis]